MYIARLSVYVVAVRCLALLYFSLRGLVEEASFLLSIYTLLAMSASLMGRCDLDLVLRAAPELHVYEVVGDMARTWQDHAVVLSQLKCTLAGPETKQRRVILATNTTHQWPWARDTESIENGKHNKVFSM